MQLNKTEKKIRNLELTTHSLTLHLVGFGQVMSGMKRERASAVKYHNKIQTNRTHEKYFLKAAPFLIEQKSLC